jgi:beta-lactamase class A
MTAARIERAFTAIGLRGWLHARDLDSGDELGLRADEPVVLASVFKVALVAALYRLHDAGALDVSRQVEVTARTDGATGVAAMLDPARLSLRDLAYLAIAVSDNAAADVLFDVVGDEAVADVSRALGLARTRIVHRCRDIAEGFAEGGMLDPARTNAGTPREMTALLAAIWSDRAASPASCEAIRRLMRLQVWPHRLASGFPEDAVAGKTGTLPGVRNEIGVVERADGRRFAVAVFTRADTPAASLPQADRVIGTVARIAVEALS